MTRRRAAIALLLASLLAVGARADELSFEMRIVRGHLPEAKRLVRVKQGDVVRFRWRTDQPGELHIHGYDIERKLVPGTVAEVTITARATGRFPIHLHGMPGSTGGQAHDEATLATLEVYPR